MIVLCEIALKEEGAYTVQPGRPSDSVTGVLAAGVAPGGSAMRRLMSSSIFVAVSFRASVSLAVMSASVILLVSFWCKTDLAFS